MVLPPDVDVVWAPQAGSQELFLSCPIFEVLYEGTRGPGKTDALLMDFVQHVGRALGPDWRGILFRRTYPELADIVAKSRKWFPQIFPGAVFNKQEYTWTFPDGEQLLLRHAKTEADYWAYHGHAYPWIGWEELTNWADDKLYRRMMSCCRSTNPRVPKKVRSTCNPYGIGHNWVKKRFRLPDSRGIVIRDSLDQDGVAEPLRVALHGTIYENRILLDADPEYVGRLRASARNKAELRAWLHGAWDIVAGGMFDDVWDAQRHVVAPFRVPHSWRIDRSLDWGSSKPFSVGWWAESDGTDLTFPDGTKMRTVRGDLFRVAEWYGAHHREANLGLNIESGDVARGIEERELAMVSSGILPRRPLPGPADTSIWSSEDGPTIASKMAAKGILWERADKAPGSRKNGWEEMRSRLIAVIPPWERMNAEKDASIFEWKREERSLFVSRSCRSFIDLVPVLPRDDKDLDDVDTDAEDHIGDEVRYRVRYRPKGLVQADM